ncbi:hypothetical protein AB433_16015 [Croceicoccus naphthovorans]|uniref:Cysteine biosynthesis protein n=1 Tax=Croceicoccus naphthovorans TaxID=1348774 RepID=A0A0G3XKZ8_9SPHN|nr:hypothetical protein AB433_16015 [Croceicoccus naphthovorans]
MPQAFALAFAQVGDRRVIGLLIKSVLISLVLAALLAFALVVALGWTFGAFYGSDVDTQIPWIGTAMVVVLGALGLVAGWLAWRIVAMAVIQFYADEVVAIVESEHYPALAARDLPLGEQTAMAIKGALRALIVNLIALPFALALFFTAIGPALVFVVVNAFLLGRELQEMVWARHRHDGATAPLGFASRFLLGLATVGLLAVPFVNFLAPFLSAAAATHLVHRVAMRQTPR